MKLAVFHNLPKGGALNQINGVVKILKQGCSHLDLYCPKTNKWPNPKSAIEYLSYVRGGKYDSFNQSLAKEIDNKKYDWVILGGDWITQTPMILNFLKTPSLYLMQEMKRNFYEKTEWGLVRCLKQKMWDTITNNLKYAEIRNLRKAKIVIVNSNFSSKKLSSKVKNNTEAKVIYPFIRDRFFARKSKVENFFLSVGNLSKIKGYKFIIEALATIPKRYRFPFCLVGHSGCHEKELLCLAEKLNVNLILKKDINDSELFNLYKTCFLYLYFPEKEPFGLTPLEALCSRNKVLAVNEGGFTEIARNSTNIELLPRDVGVLSKRIIGFVKNPSYSTDLKFIKEIRDNHNVNEYTNQLMRILKGYNTKR